MVTADPILLDHLLRLAGAAGVDVEVATDLVAARDSWSAAPLVLLGDDIARRRGATRAVQRRAGAVNGAAGVVLVSEAVDDAGVWQRAADAGADHVAVLPDAEPWLSERLRAVAVGRSPGGARVCVLGGRGGGGATTLAAALAITAAGAGVRTMLLDADPLGGGIDLVLGGEDSAGLRWPDLTAAAGRLDSAALRNALPATGALVVLSWDRGDPVALPVETLDEVLLAAHQGSDLVVIDVPRHLDPAAEVALRACDVALVVVPAEVRACASALRVAAAVRPLADDVRLVVRGPSPAGLTASDVAEAVGLPLAAWLPAEPGITKALERGEPPAGRGHGPLAEFSRSFLSSLPLPARPAGSAVA